MSDGRGRVRVEPSHKRVRIVFGGELIVDSDDALYVWEGPSYPQYYLPQGDVVAGGREATDAAWSYRDSPITELRDRVRFEWRAMDAWFEEDEEVFVHPRDPSTRVQILPTSRHVTVSVDGLVVADSRHPTFLYETGLPRRTYFPKLDVRMDLLVPTEKTSMCPYKGTARYWTVVTPEIGRAHV